MKDFEKLLREFGSLKASANVTCRDLLSILGELGFEIRDCGSAGHKIARHPAIELLDSPNFDCGHSLGDKIKRPYLVRLYNFVKLHQESIKDYLKS